MKNNKKGWYVWLSQFLHNKLLKAFLAFYFALVIFPFTTYFVPVSTPPDVLQTFLGIQGLQDLYVLVLLGILNISSCFQPHSVGDWNFCGFPFSPLMFLGIFLLLYLFLFLILLRRPYVLSKKEKARI
jgi:hypothetical protein